MSEDILVVENVTAGYDTVDVLHGVSLRARAGEITCLLGANGAGKSTMIKSIFSILPLRSGAIRFAGEDISKLETHLIVARGIAVIPEGNRVFAKLSVLENLRVGAYLERSSAKIAESVDRVFELFPRLKERSSQYAGTLSGGERSMLCIGRSLMSSPKMLVIDEPSLGLSPRFVKENFKIIRDLCAADCSILLVEQNAKQTLDISHHGYVMAQGKIVFQGAATELRSSAQVADAYFGAPSDEQVHAGEVRS